MVFQVKGHLHVAKYILKPAVHMHWVEEQMWNLMSPAKNYPGVWRKSLQNLWEQRYLSITMQNWVSTQHIMTALSKGALNDRRRKEIKINGSFRAL